MNNRTCLPLVWAALSIFGLVMPLRAQVAGPPHFVDYQGVVFDGTSQAPLGSTEVTPSTTPKTYQANPTNYTMHFKIFSAPTGGTLIWAERQTVTVSLGKFSVRLGLGQPISGLSPAPTVAQNAIHQAFDASDRYLELTVIPTGQTSGTPTLPRLAFQASPFSFVAERAVRADTVNGGTLSGAITTTGATFSGGTFTGGSYSGGTYTGGTFSGSFSGNGSGLTNLTASQIPNLDAGKITTGTLSTNRIPNLSTNQLTSGTLPVARGGTGYSYKNFVDLSNDQTVGGKKTFSRQVNITSWDNETVNSFFFNANPDYADPDDSPRGFSGEISFSLRVAASIKAQGYHAVSDRRIKTAIAPSDMADDLDVVQRLRVVNYRMKDPRGGGPGLRKGFIAQEIAKEIPDAVSAGEGVIPNIYSKAVRFSHGSPREILRISLEKPHELVRGDKVRIITEYGSGMHEVVSAVSDSIFEIEYSHPSPKQVFVYGKQIDDFLSIDYNQVFATGISAIQQLKTEKDAEIEALKEENASLRARLDALEAREQKRDELLSAMEKLLLPEGPPVAQTVGLKQGVGAE